MSTGLEVQEIVNDAFDSVTGAMRTISVGAANSTTCPELDIQDIWNRVYDASTQSIRTVS